MSEPDKPNSRNNHAFTDMDYQTQLETKVADFQTQLSAYYKSPISVFRSPETGYRMRAEFGVWHEGKKSNYVMRKPGTRERYNVDHFPMANESIQKLMPSLLNEIESNELIRHRLFSVEFLSTLSGEMLVTLIYHKLLDSDWENRANQLRETLDINLIGRSKKQKLVLGQDFVTEQVDLDEKRYMYRQYESAFTQPNAAVNKCMLQWSCQQAKSLNGDLLELYCGNGNFTLPLAGQFDNVLATEISKISIKALNWGLEANQISNVEHARLSAEEITEALDRTRPFRRLSHIDLDSYDFQTVFVDPPRAGIDKKTLCLLSRFENIIYISCNPVTLIENLESLGSSHQLLSAAVFDQFPFTPHLETGVLLKKR